MRGRISDQDLTDYALNELAPADRLYVESMLAVSEECRHDVCEMIDMGLLLEQGFERVERIAAAEELRPEQREALLSVRARPSQYFHRVVAGLAAAAVLTVAAIQAQTWQWKRGGGKVAQVSKHVVEAVTSDNADFGVLLADWRQLADDPVLTKWFTSEWFESVPASGWDSVQRTSFEVRP